MVYPKSTRCRTCSAVSALWSGTAAPAEHCADLVTILRRIEDPHDWLKAKVVGVRLAPFWAVRSRFGIDTRDPDVLATAAELLNGLPEDVEIGFHQH